MRNQPVRTFFPLAPRNLDKPSLEESKQCMVSLRGGYLRKTWSIVSLCAWLTWDRVC